MGYFICIVAFLFLMGLALAIANERPSSAWRFPPGETEDEQFERDHPLATVLMYDDFTQDGDLDIF